MTDKFTDKKGIFGASIGVAVIRATYRSEVWNPEAHGRRLSRAMASHSAEAA